MKAQHTITQIAGLLGRSNSTISRELQRNSGSLGYRPKQACGLSRGRETVIGANHKHAIVTVVEHKRGYAVIVRVSNKTVGLVRGAIVKALKPFEARVKTLTYDNEKEFCGHANMCRRSA